MNTSLWHEQHSVAFHTVTVEMASSLSTAVFSFISPSLYTFHVSGTVLGSEMWRRLKQTAFPPKGPVDIDCECSL